MATSSNKNSKVAVLLFDHADILDFAGPVEILSSSMYSKDMANPGRAFDISLVGRGPAIRAGGVMTVSTDMTIEEASKQIDTFDILIIPGGSPQIIMGMVQNDAAELQFAKDFANQTWKESAEERIIFSVCTGALILAATGALANMKATTHHLSLDTLRQIEPSANVASSVDDTDVGRYIDGGLNKKGMRVITAGGVTCGLDASLYVGELKAGREAAQFVAKINEYEWRRT